MNKKILLIVAVLSWVCFLQAQKKEGFKKGVHDYVYSDGRIYSGEWLDRQPNGQGIMAWPEGYNYSGTFVFGKPSGKGIMHYADGASYEGEWLAGKRTGIGTFTTSDGSKYVGYWTNDALSGKGMVTFANGDVYEGVLNDTRITGTGKLTKKSGDIYEGIFEDGKPIKYKRTSNEGWQSEGEVRDGHRYETENTEKKITVPGSRYPQTFSVETKTIDGVVQGRIHVTSSEGTDLLCTIDDNNNIQECDGVFVLDGCRDEGHFVNFLLQGEGSRTWTSVGFKEIANELKIIVDDLEHINCSLHGITEGPNILLGSAGDKYVGQFKDGEFCGQGTFTWADGRKYVGEWKDGKQNGRGTVTMLDIISAIGEWKNGYPWNAMCEHYRYNRRWEYTGKIENGETIGQGSIICYSGNDEGSEYKGGFKGLFQFHGHGTMIWADGSKYDGQWKDNDYHGQGIEIWADGSKYVGLWVKGKKTGQGTMIWANGSKYVGQWKDDEFQGQGTFTYADGSKYVGQWVNSQKCGQGTYTWPNGNKYVGRWSGDTMNGQGTMTFGRNQPWIRSTGVFRNGTMVSGTLVRTNGTFVGEWYENGNAKSVKKIR